MNIDPYTGKLTATKSEVKRFVEARILSEVGRRNADDEKLRDFFEGLSNDLKRAAVLVGEKHLNADGYLQETARQAAANSGVPG